MRPLKTQKLEQIVWDSNLAAADVPYYSLSVAAADPQDRRILIGEDTTGSEELVLRVLDMDSGDFYLIGLRARPQAQFGMLPGKVFFTPCWMKTGAPIKYAVMYWARMQIRMP